MADSEKGPEIAHSSPKVEEDRAQALEIPKSQLLGASLLYMIANYMNTFGNLSMYVGSYMYTVGKNEWLRYRNISAVFGLGVTLQSAAGLFSVDFQRYFGTKKAITISGIVVSLSFLLCAFGLHNYNVFMTFYGVLASIASGLLLPLPLDIILRKYPKRRGFICGFIFFVGGTTSIFLIPMQTYFVNLSDEKFVDSFSELEAFHKPLAAVDRVPRLFVFQGLVYFIALFFGLKLLNLYDSSHSTDADYTDPELEYETFITKRLMGQKESTDEDTTLRTVLCYVLWFFLVLCWLSAMYLHTYWKIAALKKLDALDLTISIIGTMAGFANLLGRCIWGFIFDSFGWKCCWTLLLSGTCAATVGTRFLFEPDIIFYSVWVTSAYFLHSGVLTVAPMTAHRIVGPSKFVSTLGFLNTSRGIAGILFTSYAMYGFKNFSTHLPMAISGICFAGLSVVKFLADQSADGTK